MGANAIDEKMASLMNLEQEWRDEEDEDYREDLSDELEEELESSPAGLSEVQERFFESVKEEVAKGVPLEVVPQAVERGRQMLPVRNQCTDIPGHVTCFKELNGLIHGGILYAPSYTLKCWALRFETIGGGHHGAQVGGGCEQKNQSGKIISKWTSRRGAVANDPLWYYKPDTWMLWEWCKKDESVGYKRCGRALYGCSGCDCIGFYLPKDYYLKAPEENKIKKLIDSGFPNRDFYTGSYKSEIGFNMWINPPSYETAVENALYNKQPVCSEGFLVCTPYIKIFAPDPESGETIVWMIGADRYYNFSSKSYRRSAQWYCKTFK